MTLLIKLFALYKHTGLLLLDEVLCLVNIFTLQAQIYVYFILILCDKSSPSHYILVLLFQTVFREIFLPALHIWRLFFSIL